LKKYNNIKIWHYLHPLTPTIINFYPRYGGVDCLINECASKCGFNFGGCQFICGIIRPSVRIVGVYRALGNGGGVNGQSSTSGVFRTVVLVNHVVLLGRDSMGLNYMADDVKAIRSLANPHITTTTTPSIHHPILNKNHNTQQHKILDILGRSMAPSIHGHTTI